MSAGAKLPTFSQLSSRLTLTVDDRWGDIHRQQVVVINKNYGLKNIQIQALRLNQQILGDSESIYQKSFFPLKLITRSSISLTQFFVWHIFFLNIYPKQEYLLPFSENLCSFLKVKITSRWFGEKIGRMINKPRDRSSTSSLILTLKSKLSSIE